MSVRSGRKTSRYPLDVYKGFRIIKVKIIEYYRSSFSREYTNYPEKIETHYTFCKEGEEKRPSQDYNVWAKTQHECIECIDKFIKDNSLYYTHEEREKYVYQPNKKCGWGYGYESLMKLLKAHQKADKRMKILIEDRLTDANFHAESGFLSEGKYDEFIKIVRKTYPFREKFEVITSTECKRIKDPKALESGLSKVIGDYLASQGIKDTSVHVNFLENW